MDSQCLNANSKQDSRNNLARTCYSPSPSIVPACLSRLPPSDSRGRFKMEELKVDAAAIHATAQKWSPRILSFLPFARAQTLLNLKYCNQSASRRPRSPSSRIPSTGSISSLLRLNRTWRNSVSIQIGGDHSSPQVLTPTTTPSSGGNSTTLKIKIKLGLERGTLSSQSLTSSLVLTTTGPRERVSVPKNTLTLRSPVKIYQNHSRSSSLAKKYT